MGRGSGNGRGGIGVLIIAVIAVCFGGDPRQFSTRLRSNNKRNRPRPQLIIP